MAAITSKRQMYELLLSGRLGNYNRGFTSVYDWYDWADRPLYPLWGVRSMAAGDRRLALDVPAERVPLVVHECFPAGGYQISPMVDPWTLFRGEAYDGPVGLRVYGVFGHMGLKWREAMNRHGREWAGLGAQGVLDAALWPGDREDFRELLQLYPGHVLEFSACARAVGVLPHRNAVVWEVRCASGEYEKWV